MIIFAIGGIADILAIGFGVAICLATIAQHSIFYRFHRAPTARECALCHVAFTNYNDIVADHINPRGMGGAW
jgi:hypothetical protein